MKPALPLEVSAEGARRRILEVALQLFARHGFHGASVRDLTQALELQPSQLYVHFDSKEALLAELVEVGHRALLSALQAALEGVGSDPRARLRAIVGAHAAVHARFPQLAVVVNEEMDALSPSTLARSSALRDQGIALLVDCVMQGIAAGVFAVENLNATVAAIAAMGLRVPYWFEATDAASIDALAETHATLALRLVGAAP